MKAATAGTPCSSPVVVCPVGREGTRKAILTALDDVERLLLKGKAAQAVDKLRIFRKRLDGCGATPDTDDWIRVCSEKLELRDLIAISQ